MCQEVLLLIECASSGICQVLSLSVHWVGFAEWHCHGRTWLLVDLLGTCQEVLLDPYAFHGILPFY